MELRSEGSWCVGKQKRISGMFGSTSLKEYVGSVWV
jgi:hypothetical protein